MLIMYCYYVEAQQAKAAYSKYLDYASIQINFSLQMKKVYYKL
jgi:hypothetical protein